MRGRKEGSLLKRARIELGAADEQLDRPARALGELEDLEAACCADPARMNLCCAHQGADPRAVDRDDDEGRVAGRVPRGAREEERPEIVEARTATDLRAEPGR